MKEKRPKLKPESSKQGSSAPDALGQVYGRPGISASQEKVSKKDERRILAQLSKEGSLFVPNVWPVLKEKCRVIAKSEMVAPKDEKRILNAVRAEADSFIPDDLASVEQTCGTVQILDTQEALAFNEKMKNEAGSFLASSKDGLYAQTGLRQKAGFWGRNHFGRNLVISGSAIGAVAAITVLAIALTGSNSASLTPASGSVTFVNLKITPASANAETTSEVLKKKSVLAVSDSSANIYQPESSFEINSNGNGSAASLTAKNYSAAQVGQVIDLPGDVTAPEFSTTWLNGSFEKGYLETKRNDVANSIEVKIASSDLGYYQNEQVQNMYRQQIVSFLKENYIYSGISFNDTTETSEELAAFGSNHQPEETEQIYGIYDRLVTDPTIEGADFATYAACLDGDSEAFRTSFADSLKQIIAAPLSDNGRNGVIAAVDIAYKTYKGVMKTSVQSPFANDEYSYERCREDLIDMISPQYEWDSYFFYSDVDADDYAPVTVSPDPHWIFDPDSSEYKQAVQAVRDYLIIKNCATEKGFLALMADLSEAAELESQSPDDEFSDYLYDPDYEDRDPGDWYHGDGPEDHPDDWGHGGEWGDGR